MAGAGRRASRRLGRALPWPPAAPAPGERRRWLGRETSYVRFPPHHVDEGAAPVLEPVSHVLAALEHGVPVAAPNLLVGTVGRGLLGGFWGFSFGLGFLGSRWSTRWGVGRPGPASLPLHQPLHVLHRQLRQRTGVVRGQAHVAAASLGMRLRIVAQSHPAQGGADVWRRRGLLHHWREERRRRARRGVSVRACAGERKHAGRLAPTKPG